MVGEFSEATKFWIENRAILFAAEKRFGCELSDILQRVGDNLKHMGWRTRLTGGPFDQIQVCRPHWPTSLAGIHYEARVFPEFLREGIMDLNLHVEDDVPDQEAVCNRMRDLFMPHAADILKNCGMSISEEPIETILTGSIRLSEVTAQGLTDGFERMAITESFVDEALYLADKRTVYRTEFEPGTQPSINFKGNTGGWEFDAHGGRFDGPCLKCHGNEFNWDEGEDTNILMLHPEAGFVEFANNRRMFLSAIVSSPQGGELWVGTQACKNGKWITIFGDDFKLKGTEQWQHVTLEGLLKAPANYDFSRDGLFAYVLATAPHKEMCFASIDVGLCSRRKAKA